MRQVRGFNGEWRFLGAAGEDGAFEGAGETVVLPHTAVEMPISYFDEEAYQKPFGYEKDFVLDDEATGREIYLHFDGAMADSRVSLNGQELCRHKDGYTPFSVRLTESLRPGMNKLSVRLDGSENPDIPPFGGQIDYLTYAGIYRDVWLMSLAPVFLKSVKIETPDVLAEKKTVHVTGRILNPRGLAFDGTVSVMLRDPEGRELARQAVSVEGEETFSFVFTGLENIRLWGLNDPALYTLAVELESQHGSDGFQETFGFREVKFSETGFRLNGEPVKIVGLNRHQSFPYTGYAQGRVSQEKDAEILKFELGCNLVRTSHYPQSKWFLDHCDRIGLLVLEEIPGWQHIGGKAWKAEAVQNVRRMIERDWNHPSIVAWGVRINESPDDHDFYAETNRTARALDATRQTCGIRKHAESELLEDIYTMNDFSLESDLLPERTPLRAPRVVTGLDRDVPYLVTEFNGHMFPTKVSDNEARQVEHVTRHLEVLNAAFGNPNISGCIAWCMFDYNTHKDFGSGDRICHHGVMTMFREPKFAAYAYASQMDPAVRTVLKPVTYWARGERDIGGVLPLMILTNCEEVELRFQSGATLRKRGDAELFPHLPHPPVILRKEDVTDDVFGKWGLKWQGVEIAGFVEGEEVETLQFVADPVATTLEVAPDRGELNAAGRDEVRVMVRALDQAGALLPFLADQIDIEVDGPARLLGPGRSPLVGGTTGFWLQATGAAGPIRLKVSSSRFETQEIWLTATAGVVPAGEGLCPVRAIA